MSRGLTWQHWLRTLNRASKPPDVVSFEEPDGATYELPLEECSTHELVPGTSAKAVTESGTEFKFRAPVVEQHSQPINGLDVKSIVAASTRESAQAMAMMLQHCESLKAHNDVLTKRIQELIDEVREAKAALHGRDCRIIDLEREKTSLEAASMSAKLDIDAHNAREQRQERMMGMLATVAKAVGNRLQLRDELATVFASISPNTIDALAKDIGPTQFGRLLELASTGGGTSDAKEG